MAVRNFWATVNVDGYKTEMAGGPRSKEGGLTVEVKQRDEGQKVTAVKVRCFEVDGGLFSEVSIGGKVVGTYSTRR